MRVDIKTAPICLINYKHWYLALCIVVTLAFCPMIIKPGEPLQLDLPVWTSMTHLLRTEIAPEQKWFWGILIDREQAGLVHGESYSLSLILPWMLSLIVKAELAVKLVCWFTGLMFSLGFYFLAIRFSKPLFSMIAASLVFIVAYDHITDGMWYNQFSIAAALWFWIALERYLEHKSNYVWSLSIFLLAILFYCHPIGSLGAMIIWGTSLLYLIFRRDRQLGRLEVLKFISIPVIAILLAAPQIFCIFDTSMHTDIGTNLQHIPWRQQVGLMLNINFLNKWLQILIIMIATLGFVNLWRAKKRVLLVSFVLFVITIAIICRLFAYLPLNIRSLSQLMFFSQRFQYLSQVLYLFWFAIGLNSFFKISKSKRTIKVFSKNFVIAIFLTSLIFLFFIYTTNQLIKYMGSGRQMTLGVYPERWEIYELFNWIDKNIDASKTRIFIEDTKGTYKWKSDYPEPSTKNCATHILALSDIYTSVLHVGGWFYTANEFSQRYRGDGGSLFGMSNKAEFSELKLFNNMWLLNCQYLLANSTQVIDFLDTVSFLECLKSIGRFRIYKHRQFEPAWAFFESGYINGLEVEKKSSTELFIHNIGKRKENLIVSISYNKRWKAYVAGEEIPVHSKYSLIYLPLISIEAPNIHLKYEIEKTIPIIGVILGFIFLFSIFILSNLKLGRYNEN